MNERKKEAGGRIGGVLGGAAGLGWIGSTFAGLSGPAITHTLVAIGGSMVGGIVAVAAAPIAIGAAGYAIGKTIVDAKRKKPDTNKGGE
jgi:hypothetical protein